MVRNALVAGLVVSLLTIGSAQAQSGKPDAARPKNADVAALQRLVAEMNAAWERKDVAWFEANTVHDADIVNFGTDAAETWIGWEPYWEAAKKQVAAMERIKAKVRDVRVKVHAPGKVASVTYVADFEGVSSGQKFAIQGMRVLNVLEKRSGRWLFSSGHASLPWPVRLSSTEPATALGRAADRRYRPAASVTGVTARTGPFSRERATGFRPVPRLRETRLFSTVRSR